MSKLFQPITVGAWQLPHRFVMAPLTRNRAGEGMVPTDLNVTYYSQRASAGLIVTEGTQPSVVGQGYLNTPGMHTPEQAAGWAKVAEAVHADGGRLVVQLMHAGRMAHRDNKNGAETVAPSAVRASGEMFTASGMLPFDEPRALESAELPGVVREFVDAARLAVDAGLDGVELHAANGYLLHQFLAPTTNLRDDEYGGSPQARARFVAEVVTAVAQEIGAQRVGLRISPGNQFNDMAEPDEADRRATYEALIEAIAPLDLAYLSVLGDSADPLLPDLRSRFGGPLILNTGFAEETSLAEVERLLDQDVADLVAVGRAMIANPDLARRWKEGAGLNTPDGSTFYGGAAEGYTDYPFLTEG